MIEKSFEEAPSFPKCCIVKFGAISLTLLSNTC